MTTVPPATKPLSAINRFSNRNALRISVVYLIAASLAFVGELYLAFQSGAWQVYAIAGLGATLAITAGLSIALVRNGKDTLGMKLLIGASLAGMLLAPFLVAGVGLLLGLGTLLVISIIAFQTLPQQQGNIALVLGVAVALVAGGIDLLAPPSQLTIPGFQTLLLILGGLIILAYSIFAIRLFGSFPLTTKLILTFLAVSLIPLGILAAVNDWNTRQALITEARQSLLNGVSQASVSVDDFIKSNLNTIRTEAQLPVLSAYLSLDPADRATSPQKMAVENTLRELSRKDKVFINSYSLLDNEGLVVVDTNPANVGLNEAEGDYFSKPLITGLPYVSPVYFGKNEAADRGVFYFSHPIRNEASDEIVGVLRLGYKANILQHLVVQHNNTVGPNSFAMLFDEHLIRLAHGKMPDLISVAVLPFDDNTLAELIAKERLPANVSNISFTNLPDLAQGLTNALFEPHFTTPLAISDQRENLVAVVELENQPWYIAFAQPEEVFLAPIQAQTRTALFIAIAIAGLVVASAFAMGQLLAHPLLNLTHTVSKFAAGDLSARAKLSAQDESGLLANSFNTMAERVEKLLTSLEERTEELESEISERERAEVQLQTSEARYRTIFETSNDAIFITAPNGQILDINPTGLALSGYSLDEIRTLRTKDFYADVSRLLVLQETLESEGAITNFEVTFKRKDNSLVSCMLNANLRLDENGNVLGYQGIIRDITEQKQIERERIRLAAIERELTLARDIEQSLLPPPKPNWPSPDIVCYSTAAHEVGGDFYAYHAFNSTQASLSPSTPQAVAIAVGDVSGKGMPAALLMGVSLASFQTIVGQNLPPSQLLAHLDEAITPYTSTTDQNCALVYAKVTYNSNGSSRIRAANAGCIPPLIRRKDGRIEWLEIGGLPLGLGLEFGLKRPEAKSALHPGDLVILSSDGVTEAIAPNGKMYGFDQFEAAVANGPISSAQEMLNHLKDDISAFIGPSEYHDDLTIVVMRV